MGQAQWRSGNEVASNTRLATAWAAGKRDDKMETGEQPSETLRHIRKFNIQKLGANNKNKNKAY